jgi:hypothetical protein
MGEKAKVGGILSIISGAFGFVWLASSLLMIYMVDLMFREPFYEPFSPYGGALPGEFLTVMLVIYGAPGVLAALIGALGIIGGIFALKRRRWGLALAGAIASTLTFFPCGIPAIIFVAMAQPDFSASQPPAPVD